MYKRLMFKLSHNFYKIFLKKIHQKLIKEGQDQTQNISIKLERLL
jgi:hypothetical protein